MSNFRMWEVFGKALDGPFYSCLLYTSLDRLEGKAKSILELSSLFIWIAFSIFLAFQGWKMTMFVASMQQTSPALYIPMYLVYASVPVGSMLMTARLLLELKNFLSNALSGRGEAL